jgi:hypothetical protein
MRALAHIRRLAWLGGCVVGLTVATVSVMAQSAVTVVMSGLDNPRGLAIGPEGALYVAEAGRGGPGPDPCGLNSPGETRYCGRTGAVSRLWRGEQERIAEGLPSHALLGGTAAQGPNDISFHGRGGAYVTIGLGDDRDELKEFDPAFGTLLHMSAAGIGVSSPTSWSTRRRPIPAAARSTPMPTVCWPKPARGWSLTPAATRCFA